MEKTQAYHFIQKLYLQGEHKIADMNLIFLQSSSISPPGVSTKWDPVLKDVSFLTAANFLIWSQRGRVS